MVENLQSREKQRSITRDFFDPPRNGHIGLIMRDGACGVRAAFPEELIQQSPEQVVRELDELMDIFRKQNGLKCSP